MTLGYIKSHLADLNWLRLIFRADNKVADYLANLAHATWERVLFREIQDSRRQIQKWISLDRIGIPSFGHSRNMGIFFPC